jgi:hypothetical protein
VVWLDYALACKYMNHQQYSTLLQVALEVGKLINFMINNPEKFGVGKE